MNGAGVQAEAACIATVFLFADFMARELPGDCPKKFR